MYELQQSPIMRIAARHRSLEAQVAARGRHRDQALQEEVRRNRLANEELAEDESTQPRCAPPDEDDDEPLPARQAFHQSDVGEEDPLMLESKALVSQCREHLGTVTAMIEWAVPLLVMGAAHAATSVDEARRYVQIYLTWRHAVTRLWHPEQPWPASLRAEAQLAMVARVESTDEFRAVRRLLDRARKATDEYKSSEHEYRRKPEVKVRNAQLSKARMRKYRERKAAEKKAADGG